MTKCQRCDAKSPNAFLCQRCERTIAGLLADMPWWLNRLVETATGQTRMADTGGRRSARRKDLDGETPLAECIERFPDDTETDLDKARAARAKAALAHALAAGRVNAKASELLGAIDDSLRYWVKELCDSRGVPYTRSPLARATAPGSEYATWLRVHVASISASELAGDIAMDIETHLDDIVAAVNRPVHVMFLGACPTWIEDRNTTCGRRLRAPQDAIEVHCRACAATHNVNRLLMGQLSDAKREPVAFDELVRINSCLPDGYGIPARTLRWWRQSDALKPRGWLRADGHRGITRHNPDDVPLYSWSDVEKLRDSKRQKGATGASAHKRNAGVGSAT